TKTQAFARNGVNSAGSIADQRDVVSRDATQTAHAGDSAAFNGGRLNTFEPLREFGMFCNQRRDASTRIETQHRDANFVIPKRGHVSLGIPPPIHFYILRPRRDLKMLLASKSFRGMRKRMQAGPLCDTRLNAVRANDPFSRMEFSASDDTVAFDFGCWSVPEKFCAG